MTKTLRQKDGSKANRWYRHPAGGQPSQARSLCHPYTVAWMWCAVLLVMSGCGQPGGPVSQEARVLEERAFMRLLSKDEPLERVEGEPNAWRWADAQVAAWHPKAVTATSGVAYGKRRWSLFAHAPAMVTLPAIEVGEEPHVRFGWYISPTAYAQGTDGASFRVWCATEATGQGTCVFQADCLVRSASEPTGVKYAEVQLPVESGESVRLSFETDPGPSGRKDADWTAWEMPVLRWYRRVKTEPNPGPNAVLFTLDTLRADRLSCYGYRRKTSPAIDALATRGTLMTRAYAQSTTTVPSHISIMTSKYLNEFGIYEQSSDPLPSRYRTLAECLRDAGYATAGFVGAGFMRDTWTGLGQGFDTFVECPIAFLDAEYVVNPAIDWLVRHRGERFFAWIHLYDCHVPYDPPVPFRDHFVSPQAAYLPHLDPSVLLRRDDEKFERLNRDYYSDRYDGAVAYTDHQVGQLVSTLRDLGILDETLIVVAADHGECLGEHSIYFDHVSLYEPNVRVPLIFHWPGRLPEGKRCPELCENVDIYPTILELLGLEIRGRLSGRSLVPVWHGRARGREGVVAEHSGHAAVSWRTGEWTYLYQPIADETVRVGLPKEWTEGPLGQWVLHVNEEELYDRREDPDELHDKSSSASEILQALRSDCAEWVQACEMAWEGRRAGSGPPQVDRDRIEQLRALGYVR